MREWKAHSYEKISILADYLGQFATASQRAVNRVYIDAFAGDTSNVLWGSGLQFPGSAELALSVSPAFTHVRLFEKRSARAAALRALRAAAGSRSVEVVEGDCNVEMAGVLARLPVQAPTFAFLDPDGMELHWSTIRRIADHKRNYADEHRKNKVEMWILFSSGGIVLMLGSNRAYAESQGFPEKVARLYGAWGPWQAVWAARLERRITPGDAKQAYLFLYMDRLAALGYKHLLVRPIQNSRNELYAMVFASDSLAGKSLMQWAQERARFRPPGRNPLRPRRGPAGLRGPPHRLACEFPMDLPPWDELDA